MNVHPDDKISVITTTPAIAVGRGMTLRDTARTLAANNVGALIVVEGGESMGLVSERDIVRALADGADPDGVRASDVMTEEPRYVTSGEPIAHVAKHMVDVGVRHMPVFDEGEIIGMVSARDALHVFSDTFEEGESRR